MASPANGLLFLNHYKNKSKEEWEIKVKTVNNYGYMKGKWIDKPFEFYEDKANEVEDIRIWRFIPELREFMSKKLTMNPRKKPYFLVLVCMFREEDIYLKEWLDYYILQGVDHFYLYDNDNPKSTMKILKPYIKNKYVTVVPWPDTVSEEIDESKQRKKWSEYNKLSTQNLAFEHFVKNYKDKYRWVIKVDVDEFMYPSKKYRNVRDVLKKAFDENTTKGIKVPRVDFGSSGHIKKPHGLVIENFTLCENRRSSSKSIGNKKFIVEPSYGAHTFDYQEEYDKTTENRNGA